MSLTDSIQQQLTWGNIYLKQKSLFGCTFKQKIKQQNIVTVSALLKKHLKGNPETSLQYFCFHEVVDGGQKAPLPPLCTERSRAGQEGPSSKSPPDLVTVHQQLMGANVHGASLHSSGSPSPLRGSNTSVQAFHSPFQAIPTPTRTLGWYLQLVISCRGTESREGKSKTEQLGFLSKTLFPPGEA